MTTDSELEKAAEERYPVGNLTNALCRLAFLAGAKWGGMGLKMQ